MGVWLQALLHDGLLFYSGMGGKYAERVVAICGIIATMA